MSEEKAIYKASENEEDWYDQEEFETREEAIKYGEKEFDTLEPGDTFCTGTKNCFILGAMDPDSFIEALLGEHEDGLGEWAEGWLDAVNSDRKLTEEIRERLQGITDLIIERHKPSFWIIDDIEYHKISEPTAEEKALAKADYEIDMQKHESKE